MNIAYRLNRNLSEDFSTYNDSSLTKINRINRKDGTKAADNRNLEAGM